MFSSFAGVYFAVKSKSTVKCLLLTRKTLSKIWKTVYGICKPFSKILQPLTPPPLPALSLFLAQLHFPSPSPISHNSPSGTDLKQQTAQHRSRTANNPPEISCTENPLKHEQIWVSVFFTRSGDGLLVGVPVLGCW
jgi:hypothetical protein